MYVAVLAEFFIRMIEELFVHRRNNSGRSAGLVYGYLFVWAGMLAVFTCMAEFASM